MANEVILADSISYLPDYAAWDKLFAAMQADFDLGKLLIYIIDNVDESLLEHLAWQYDVLGYKGYLLATTGEQKRGLIKKALELHRYKGSIWSIKEALKSIGYQDAIIVEGDEDSWANFSLQVVLGNRVLNAAEIDSVVKMVNQYKPARCLMTGIVYNMSFTDTVTETDTAEPIEFREGNETVLIATVKKRDGSHLHDGTIDRSANTDTLILTVL